MPSPTTYPGYQYYQGMSPAAAAGPTAAAPAMPVTGAAPTAADAGQNWGNSYSSYWGGWSNSLTTSNIVTNNWQDTTTKLQAHKGPKAPLSK